MEKLVLATGASDFFRDELYKSEANCVALEAKVEAMQENSTLTCEALKEDVKNSTLACEACPAYRFITRVRTLRLM